MSHPVYPYSSVTFLASTKASTIHPYYVVMFCWLAKLKASRSDRSDAMSTFKSPRKNLDMASNPRSHKKRWTASSAVLCHASVRSGSVRSGHRPGRPRPSCHQKSEVGARFFSILRASRNGRDAWNEIENHDLAIHVSPLWICWHFSKNVFLLCGTF